MPAERLIESFNDDTGSRRGAVVPFIVADHPASGATGGMLLACDRGLRSGAVPGVIEIGVPFSDPIADGPVIAGAMHDALVGGSKPTGVLEQVARVRGEVRAAVVLMVSATLVHASGRTERGTLRFVEDAAKAGVDGFIFPDAPLEEAAPLCDACALAGLGITLLVAPTTPPQRVRAIAQRCTGFVYVLARAGITGERGGMPDVHAPVQRVREHTEQPIAVGFGISNPAHVRAVLQHADGAIVGSALVRRVEEARSTGTSPEAACESFVRSLVEAAGGGSDARHTPATQGNAPDESVSAD